MEVFREMFDRGLIYRGLKPVNWSPSSKTALAEAELEYVDSHTSHSVYVGFRVSKLGAPAMAAGLDKFSDLRAAVWSTTPWTLPANLAIALNPTAEYCVVRTTALPPLATDTASSAKTSGAAALSPSTHYLIAVDRFEHFANTLAGGNANATAAAASAGGTAAANKTSGKNSGLLEVVARFRGDALVGSTYDHPFLTARRGLPFLTGDHVTMDAGTGLVHTAPGHGEEDYELYQSVGRGSDTILSPVDDDGNFTADVGIDSLVGLNVLDTGNRRVVELCRDGGVLIRLQPYKHRYPYDWRSKQPVIMRATRQWFTRLDTVRDSVATALKSVSVIPAIGMNALQSTVLSRREWCISRQRHWGVPIPVFYDAETNEPLLTSETISHIAKLFATHGSNIWYSTPNDKVSELLPEPYRSNGRTYVRGTDTLDVWFDSGVSWRAALETKGLRAPSDLVIEGSDQHRGWFNVRLSIASRAYS